MGSDRAEHAPSPGTRASKVVSGAAALVFAVTTNALAQLPSGMGSPSPDYTQPAAWVCRPGKEAVCTTGLDAMAVGADGQRARQPFTAAADPPVDCFYVYPTASEETKPYADLAETPALDRVVRGQAGRLSARCRVFAPIYRQITVAGLRQDVTSGEHLDWRGPYRDVLAAWRDYLARDNPGRGVVLVGHSQGTILLQRLIAEEIDGRPVQKRLVSAFLAGDPGLAVPSGKRVGGVFKSIPLCSTEAEVGCVYVWSSYLADDVNAARHFGRSEGAGLEAGCESPAAPAGGPAPLLAYMPRPAMAPADDPPWVALVGQLSGRCVSDDEGAVLRVSIEPGRYAELLRASLESRGRSSWGLHPIDVNLVQGDMVEVLGAEIRTWIGR